ncbi:hypothetical protein PICMEDRAFT_148306 [Pichia membranifaciens NRRL Y-2026]|uniref:Uncharacterized protein n=1 Tax=Pichia membranifaciens NRRL Y-2026 TaxID=763406 RepID=A0A1E3NIL1_9ASCO|nr:hypothetical protein PICMEDRAFT_148306 [Pichia membranifaciens NRRL Y-2026]ODQ45969.1 hypothetical protein PICMEDRAFT_148306 [Pichia membranifaciens NRRL Y-2026]
MSKIFINHGFKCLSITTLPSLEEPSGKASASRKDLPRMIIESMCADVESVSTARLLNQIASVVVSNGLFTSAEMSRSSSLGGLIPLNSKLYSHGSNTSGQPEIETVRKLLEVKLKIDDVEDMDEAGVEAETAEKLLAGHFRFHLPGIIPPQLVILVRSPSRRSADGGDRPGKMLLFFHGNIKFLPIFTSHIQEGFDCTITDLVPDNATLQSCLDWCVVHDTLSSIGNIELWFGRLQTKGKLGTIVVHIEEKDMLEFRDAFQMEDGTDGEELSAVLNEYLASKTSISFDKLTLVKLKCQLFTLSVDGKVKFSSSMSHLGQRAKKAKGDNRLSIWWIIRRLCFVN